MLNIDEFNLQRILNVDETPIYMDMTYNKTIEKKGAKNIEIITTGGEKIRISAILSISGDGKKLPPVLIFKAKPGGKLAKKLNAIEIVKQKKIFVYCQANAWCDYRIFKDWLKYIFIPYQNCNVKKTCLLILDKAPSHCGEEILNYMNEQKIKRIFIPGGLTRKLQPLDIGINKQFKESLRKKFNLYQQTHNGGILTFKNTKIDREMIAHWVNEIWYSDTDIKK